MAISEISHCVHISMSHHFMQREGEADGTYDWSRSPETNSSGED